MVDRRLKKNLDAGGRESRASLDTSREAPEEMFASSVERTKAWKDEWTQRALPETPQIADFTFAGYQRLTVTTALTSVCV